MRFVVGAIATYLLILIGNAEANDELPLEKNGAHPEALVEIDLANAFGLDENKLLRMRKATLLPGGTLPMHPHHERPAVVYVLQGELTVYIDSVDNIETYRAGDAYKIFKSSHALRNKGNTSVEFIEVDLF